MDVSASYAYCASLTETQARNFHYGIRMLPDSRRLALCAIYAYAWEIDVVADGALSKEHKLLELARMRAQLQRLGQQREPACLALADACSRYPIPLRSFEALIDGVEMDVDATRHPTFERLLSYCQRVAGSLGRLFVSVFPEAERAEAAPLAETLFMALHVTHLLRDIKKDHARGRVYLPLEDLVDFNMMNVQGHIRFVPGEDFDALVRFEGERALGLFSEGMRVLPRLDRRSAACLGTMAGIYRRLLSRILEYPSRVLVERVSLPQWEKMEISARCFCRLDVGGPPPLFRVAQALSR